MIAARRQLRITAALGAALSTVLFVRAGSLRAESIVALGSLAVAPLGLALAIECDRHGRVACLDRVAAWLVPVGTAGAFVAWSTAVGSTSAIAGASCYLLASIVVGACGVRRLLQTAASSLAEASIAFGLTFLPMAAGWMLANRAGWRPMGFNDLVVLLTAAHFHFAGFGAPIVLGCAGRLVLGARRPPVRAFRIAAVTLCAGVPLTAIGIATTRAVETASALALATGVLVAAWVMVRDATRESSSRNPLAAALWAVSGSSLLLTMTLAATFASTGSAGRSGSFSSLISFDRMLALHGATNAIGFVFAGLLAASLLDTPPRVRAAGATFSRLRAGVRVGADFFARAGAQSTQRRPTGLVDDLDGYRASDFDPDRIHPAVRHFYEHTGAYDLEVVPDWQRGFRLGGRIWRWIARRIGQVELPTRRSPDDRDVRSSIVDLRDDVDGRTGVRGWLRTYAHSGRAVYVAAYARVVSFDQPLMNIAFPLPGGSLTSVLRFEHAERQGSLRLVTWSRDSEPVGDEGIFFANPVVPIRLPMREAITVWYDDDAGVARATHSLWLLGLRYLVLEYTMRRTGRGDGSPPLGQA